MINAINTTHNSKLNQINQESDLIDVLQTQSKKSAKRKIKGELVNQDDIVGNVIRDTKDSCKDFKNLAKALFKGESNDYDLGRINDMGLKTGGIAIAATLASSRFTGISKAMEVIGTAVFFATMSLWPKVIINKPLKKKFGFDIGQKYINSQGKKKDFFQDNQYLPWDLWDKKEINKIGDYMGVDKNLPDREELIKRKMQKIALQGNTLNLLTAGFGTPIMTALICNSLETPVKNAIEAQKLKRSAAKFENFGDSVQKLVNSKKFDILNKKKYDDLLKKYRSTQELDDGFIAAFAKVINPTEELSKVSNASQRLYDPTDMSEGIKHIIDVISDSGKKLTDKAAFIKELAYEMKKNCPEVSDELLKHIEEAVNASDSYEAIKSGIIRRLIEEDVTDDSITKTIETVLSKHSKMPTKEILDKLAKDDILYEYGKRGKAAIRLIEQFGYNLSGSASESLYTKINNALTKDIIREIDPSLGDLKKMGTADGATEALVKVFSNLAENAGPKGARGTLEYYIKRIAKVVSRTKTEYDTQIYRINQVIEDMYKNTESIPKKDVESYIDLAHGMIKKEVKNYGDSVENIIIRNKNMIEGKASRLILIADVEKRLKDQGKDLSEDTIKLIRKILYEGSANETIQRQDANLKKALEFIFDGKTDELITGELKNTADGSSLVEMFEEYKQMFKNSILSGFENITDANPRRISEFYGSGINQIVRDQSQTLYKNKLWFRIFGVAAIAVVGATLLAQKFFGNTKKEEKHHKMKRGINA